MSNIDKAGTFALGDRRVKRMGYGAMQLAGPGVFGPPRDRNAAVAVLRAAVEAGINHIDTSDFYGPHVTNQIIREALHPYPAELTIVTKIGAKRGPDGSWDPAFSAADLRQAVHDNLRNLGLEAMDVVNLRLMFDTYGPAEGPIEEALSALADLQRQGLGPAHRTEQRYHQTGFRRPQDLRHRLCDRTCITLLIGTMMPSSTN